MATVIVDLPLEEELRPGKNQMSIDLSDFNNGIYFIRLKGSKTQLKRFIIAR